MANTRQAAKRSRLEDKRQARNRSIKSATKHAVRDAILALEKGDAEKAKGAYLLAVQKLAKAASKKVIPARRAARKTSRLTQLARKTLPAALPFKATALEAKSATPRKTTSGAKKKPAAKKKAKKKSSSARK